MGKPIVVVGSLNLDLVVETTRSPGPGETLFAKGLKQYPGGKGGNQAVAAARLQGHVCMIGRVGSDGFGHQLIASLQADRVETAALSRSETAGTGTAVIVVEEAGQNRILVIPGANGEVGAALVEQSAEIIRSASLLLLQLEIPLEGCIRAAEIAHEAGVPVILDPAPAPTGPLPERLRELTWLLTPNESEATALTGVPVGGRAGAAEAARVLAAQGFPRVIIKAGAAGAYLYAEGQGRWYAPFLVRPVDTTAAGDAFAGGLAAALQRGLPLAEAVTWATAAGAIAVTRPGAQPAMATLPELMEMLQSRRNES